MKKTLSHIGFWLLWPLVWMYSPMLTRARVFVVCGSEFLVVKPYFGSGLWQLPGGGIKFGETPEAAAARELHEEAGIRVDEEALRPLSSVRSYVENGLTKRYIIFSVQASDKKADRINDREIVDLTWLPLAGPLSGCAEHVKYAVQDYNSAPVR